jgi:hypothetical protein
MGAAWGIPILANLTVPFILSKIIDDDSYLYKFVYLGLMIGSISASYLSKSYEACKKITPPLVIRSIMNASISFAIPNLILFIIGWIPLIGTVVELAQMIPIIGGFINTILWSIFFSISYSITNTANKITNDGMCNPPLTGTISNKIFFILAGIYIVLSNLI